MSDWLAAIILGVIEGLTEFIPVSSTGHLVLAKEAMGLPDGFWDTFIVLIQLGAILAVVALYFQRLWAVALQLPSNPNARRFVLSVLVAFIPAVILGVALHDVIKSVFFESPRLICWSLLVGGVVLLLIDRFAPAPRHRDALHFPLLMSLLVGVFQCLSLIPGVSRSGATIVGAMVLGADKRAAAEFSFFLAMPTMAGAFAYDLYKSRHQIDLSHAGLIGLGFVVAFVSGIVVVRGLLDFVSRRGFAPFAWWRIVMGAGGLILLALVGR